MGGPDPVTLFYIYAIWTLAVPVIIAISSLIRMFEPLGRGSLFAAISLLSMVVLFVTILLFDLPWVAAVAALSGIGFWILSLTSATRRRAFIEIGLVVFAVCCPFALRLVT